MPMMPNRLPTHIPSSKITARARTRTAEPHTARPVAAESALSRAPDLFVLRHSDGHRPRTETW